MGDSHDLVKVFPCKQDSRTRYCPGYPEEAINTILNPFKNSRGITIVDVGAGAGRSSHLLAERGAEVFAVDSDMDKITAAEPHPNITYQLGTAEAIPFGDSAADIVTAFQAFHWFDFNTSLKEFRRILKPTGLLSLVWNYWDILDPFTNSFVKLIDEATQQNRERVKPYTGLSGNIKKIRVRLLWKFKHLPHFKNVRRYNFKLAQKMDIDDLLECAEAQNFLKHEGPLWDELQANIITLANRNETTKLVYAVSVFTAKPVK